MNIQRNILQAIASKIETISGLSGKVFIQQAPQNQDAPYVILAVIYDTPEIWFQSGCSEELTYMDVNASIFDLKVNGPINVENIANSGFYIFQNQQLTVSGYSGFTRIIERPIYLDGGVSNQDRNYFQCIQPIRFQGSRSI